MFDNNQDHDEFQPDNQSHLIHKLYTELDKKNQEIREKDQRIKELEEQLGQDTQPVTETGSELYKCILIECDEEFETETARARHLVTHNYDDLTEAIQATDDNVLEQLEQVASDRQMQGLRKRMSSEEDLARTIEAAEAAKKKLLERTQEDPTDEEIFDIVESLTSVQKDMIGEMERGDYKKARDIAEGIQASEGGVRHYYEVLKEKKLIATSPKGAKLTDRGLEVKDFLADESFDEKEREIRELALSLNAREQDILTRFSTNEWSSSKEVSGDGIKTISVKNAYPKLKDKDLLEAKTGAGAKLTSKGKQVKNWIADGEVEESESETEESGTDQRIKQLYNSNPDVRELKTDTRQKLQQYYLEQSKVSKTTDQTLKELYSNPVSDNSAKNMVWRAYTNNEAVDKDPAVKGRGKVFSVRDNQKNEYEGEQSVVKSKQKYDAMMDGTPRYELMKFSVGKLFPEEGEKEEVTFSDFTDGEGGNYATGSRSQDKKDWQRVVTDSTFHKALRHEFDAPETSFKWKNTDDTASSDPRVAGKLVIDRR